MKSFVLLFVLLTLGALASSSGIKGNVKRCDEGIFSFKKIFFVVLENQPIHVAMANSFMASLASKGTLLTNLQAIVNPSQPNYIGMIAGDTRGVRNDDDVSLTGRCLVDLLEEHHISWKTYQENYPSQCFTGNTALYKRRHNPFILFDQVRKNSTLCNKVVHSDALYNDIGANKLPQYSFYTPNMDNNGHDTSMAFAANWLDGFITPLLNEENFMRDNVIVITFDEGVIGDNTIYTLLLGNEIPAGHIDDNAYSLYSLLRLVEDQFALPSLGRNDKTANAIEKWRFKPGHYSASRGIFVANETSTNNNTTRD